MPPSTGKCKPPGSLIRRSVIHFWYWLLGLALGIRDFVLGIFWPKVELDIEKLGKRTGQTVVMTGGSRGIGLAIVKKLLQLDYTVIIGDPDVSLTEKTVEELRCQGFINGRVKILPLNLKSISSVRKFASEVLNCKEGKRIHVQINNAGMTVPYYELTEDGYEAHFQVNYLSHFLLTLLLLPRIKETAAENGKSSSCYIMHTASFFHMGGRLAFDDLEVSKVYNFVKSYANSKLCLVFHGKTLQKMVREEGYPIHVYTNNPGTIPTELWTDAGGSLSMVRGIATYICRTPKDAANSLLYPMLSPTNWEKLGGTYFSMGQPARCNSQVGQESVEKELWSRSLALIQTV